MIAASSGGASKPPNFDATAGVAAKAATGTLQLGA
jgi:hypothetical protein